MHTEAIGLEAAVDIIQQLVDVKRHVEDAVTVLQGKHPERGDLMIVIPCMGDGILCSPIAPRVS